MDISSMMAVILLDMEKTVRIMLGALPAIGD